MSLTPRQFQQLQEALLDAFTKPELAQMVYLQLGKDLDAIGGGSTLEEIVHNLIRWAERNNRIDDLVKGASATNPNNAKLKSFASRFLIKDKVTHQRDPKPSEEAVVGPNLGKQSNEGAAEVPQKAENNVQQNNTRQNLANVFQILSFLVALIALVVAIAGPSEWTQAAFALAVAIFLLSALGFIFTQWRRRRLTISAVAMMVLLLALAVAIGASATVLCCSAPRSEVPPKVSLVSMRYEAGDWNPRLVDLRHASENGIPVDEQDHLELFDFWLAMPDYVPGYVAQIEVYEDRELTKLLGYTAWSPIVAGTTNLGNLTTTGRSEYRPGVWRVPPEWIDKPLYVALVTYRNGVERPVAIDVTRLLLNSHGTAWMLDPPNASFAGVTYSVNESAAETLDQGDAVDAGIRAGPGDRLAIRSVSYRTNMSGGKLRVEAYVTDNGYRAEYVRYSAPIVTQATGEIPDTYELDWIIPPSFSKLVLRLVRDDDAILDSLILPLSGYRGADGLVETSESVRWPFDKAEYTDMEQPTDLAAWDPTAGTQIALSTAQSFSARSSLVVTRTESTGDAGVILKWYHPFRARLIVGQIYWPGPDEAMPSWAQVCVDGMAQCFDALDKTVSDKWQVFVIDLTNVCAERNEAGDCVSTEDLSSNRYEGLYLQGSLQATPDTPYTFYVDGFQLYGKE